MRALGADGLAATTVPATDVLRRALGSSGVHIGSQIGVRIVTLGIALSALGFLSQAILTGPRVYFAMASDGLFFARVATVTRRTRVPAVAILLQSLWTIVIALSGSYEHILNYVVSINFVFFGLSASCLFVLRRRDRRHAASSAPAQGSRIGFRTPGHPFTTLLFIAICWAVVLNTIRTDPRNTLIGFAILLLGIPVYLIWNHLKKRKHIA